MSSYLKCPKPNPPTCSFSTAESLLPRPPYYMVVHSYSCPGLTPGALFLPHIHPGNSQFWKILFFLLFSRLFATLRVLRLADLPLQFCTASSLGALPFLLQPPSSPVWPSFLRLPLPLPLQWLSSAPESVLSSSASQWGPCTLQPSQSYSPRVCIPHTPGRLVYFLFSKHT